MKRIIRGLPWWMYGLLVAVGLGVAVLSGPLLVRSYSATRSNSSAPIREWFVNPAVRESLITARGGMACVNAPFILPTDGFIGLLYADSVGPYTVLNRHSGVDIFGNGQPGVIPVYAAYSGYLTRLPDWFATVIIQHDDPLQPGRTIWTYYTHMGARDGSQSYVAETFPAGTSDQWVEQGTLIGYQGEYFGNTAGGGLHLHFSIVLSESDGSFRNEAQIPNTLDPSPYLGMDVNIAHLPDRPIDCMDAE